MITIIPPIDIFSRLFDIKPFDVTAKYKKSIFLHVQRVDDGLLVYNTLTRELILLNDSEAQVFENEDANNPNVFASFVDKRIFVENSLDEATLYNQVFSFASNYATKKGVNSYTILTTLDCNARCAYCYEYGAKRLHMDLKTCQALADYIERHHSNSVHLNWFGGEPLYNSEAIDEICNQLQQKQISYHSTMVSNGYLFDNDLVAHAKKNWNLERVQITLDGTESEYNRIKNYIYKEEGSPFRRVLTNISLLMDAGIRVAIRLNVAEHNIADMYNLVDYLKMYFEGRNMFYVYTGIVADYANMEKIWNTNTRNWLIQERNKLENYIFEAGLKTYLKPKSELQVAQCMAEVDSSTAVTPDGKLCKCEHVADDIPYGSVFSDEKNTEIINSWKKRPMNFSLCNTCAYLPYCLRLEKCPATKGFTCNKFEQELKFADIKYTVLNAYRNFKLNQK